ncbi:MAG: hypothetical protein WKG07_02120 [Hymenobacter sp.]
MLYVESLTNALCHQLIAHHATYQSPRSYAPQLSAAALARIDAYLEAHAESHVTTPGSPGQPGQPERISLRPPLQASNRLAALPLRDTVEDAAGQVPPTPRRRAGGGHRRRAGL